MGRGEIYKVTFSFTSRVNYIDLYPPRSTISPKRSNNRGRTVVSASSRDYQRPILSSTTRPFVRGGEPCKRVSRVRWITHSNGWSGRRSGRKASIQGRTQSP